MMDEIEAVIPAPVENEPSEETNPKIELAKEFIKKIAPNHHSISYLEKDEVKTLLFLLLLDELIPKEGDDDISLSKIVEHYEQLSLSKKGRGIETVTRVISGAINSIDEAPPEMTPFEFLKNKLGGLLQ